MQRMLTWSLELGWAYAWREPGMERESRDLLELLLPLLVPWALLLGVGALLAATLGIVIGWVWRTFINRKTSWWWFLGLAMLFGLAGLVLGLILLLPGFQ